MKRNRREDQVTGEFADKNQNEREPKVNSQPAGAEAKTVSNNRNPGKKQRYGTVLFKEFQASDFLLFIRYETAHPVSDQSAQSVAGRCNKNNDPKLRLKFMHSVDNKRFASAGQHGRRYKCARKERPKVGSKRQNVP